MPQIGFAIVISAALLVPTSVDELVIVPFVSGGGATLTRTMVLVVRNRIDPTVAPIATITIVMTALLLELSQLVGKGLTSNGAPPRQIAPTINKAYRRYSGRFPIEGSHASLS
jgi:ABC-type spermidine/putrescine transport system permease subunit II